MQIKQILIAIDQLANTLLGGWSDETISSRCWRLQGQSRRWAALRRAVDAVFGAGHCQGAYESERLRLQAPPELRSS
ncbi:MAG: hypothetical protein ABFC96_03255 [Thermoguttaceae bacterium]